MIPFECEHSRGTCAACCIHPGFDGRVVTIGEVQAKAWRRAHGFVMTSGWYLDAAVIAASTRVVAKNLDADIIDVFMMSQEELAAEAAKNEAVNKWRTEAGAGERPITCSFCMASLLEKAEALVLRFADRPSIGFCDRECAAKAGHFFIERPSLIEGPYGITGRGAP